jgi:HAD superfamily 5'-nucleotidase-like hydrolase
MLISRTVAAVVNAPRRRLRRFLSDIPRMEKVFSNTEVRLGQVDVVGFDYDYTLVSYTHEVQRVVYSLARDYLIRQLRYPLALSNAEFDPSFCIRGLVFDKMNGVLMKLSSRQVITPGSVFKGRKRLAHAQVMDMYKQSPHLGRSHIEHNCRPLLDLFSLSYGCLIADVVQLADDLQIPYDPYWLDSDVKQAIEYAHTGGGLHDIIIQDVERFIHPHATLRSYLEREREAGKKLFLLTNSRFDFVNAGMTHMLGSDSDWMDLFDLSMFEACRHHHHHHHCRYSSLPPPSPPTPLPSPPSLPPPSTRSPPSPPHYYRHRHTHTHHHTQHHCRHHHYHHHHQHHHNHRHRNQIFFARRKGFGRSFEVMMLKINL